MLTSTPQRPSQRVQSEVRGIDITAMILSILVPILGLVLGIVGIHEAHKVGRKAHGLSTTAVVLGIVGSIIWIALLVSLVHSTDSTQQFLNCLNGQINGTVPQSVDCSTQYTQYGG